MNTYSPDEMTEKANKMLDDGLCVDAVMFDLWTYYLDSDEPCPVSYKELVRRVNNA